MARLGIRWRAVLVAVLSIVLLATPALTGFTVAKVGEQTALPPRVSVKTVTPETSAAILAKVLHSSRFQEIKAKYDIEIILIVGTLWNMTRMATIWTRFSLHSTRQVAHMTLLLKTTI